MDVSNRPNRSAPRLVIDGYRVVHLAHEKRCKCCSPDIVDAIDRWLLLWKTRGLESDGSRVTLPWMIQQSERRLGVYIGESSWKNHLKRHVDIVRDLGAAELVLSDEERIRKEARELVAREAAEADAAGVTMTDAQQHIRLLEEIVRMGRALIAASPERVTVDHALTAARELARLKQDESRTQLLQALAQSQAARAPVVGAAELAALEESTDVEVLD